MPVPRVTTSNRSHSAATAEMVFAQCPRDGVVVDDYGSPELRCQQPGQVETRKPRERARVGDGPAGQQHWPARPDPHSLQPVPVGQQAGNNGGRPRDSLGGRSRAQFARGHLGGGDDLAV